MKINFIISYFIVLFLTICFVSAEEELNLTTVNVEHNATDINNYLPPEILKDYAEYFNLEELPAHSTCNFEAQIENYDEKYILNKIKQANCIPDSKTFNLIMETGWEDLAKYMITEIYLPKFIDPTSLIYTYIRNNEGKLKTIKNLVTDLNKYETIPIVYKFENFDNNIKFIIKLPDATYVPEYFSIYCIKDLFKLNAIFKSRNKNVKLVDSKNLYDHIDGECEYNYNYFDHQIEVAFNKLNKLKVWEKLFK